MLTVAEYLEQDFASETKLEYYHGQIVALAGASREHNLICGNLIGELRSALRGRPCEVYTADQKVKTITGAYFYPDVSVGCDPQFEKARHDILLNPVIVIEVLSPTTEARDRGFKFEQYRSISSLKEILFVAQDRRCIDRYTRQPEGWLLTTFSQEETQLALFSLGISLSLDEIYLRVLFPEQPQLVLN